MNLLLGLFCLAVVLIYAMGLVVAGDVNFYEGVVEQQTDIFDGGFTSFFYQLPLAAWWYIGVECIILLANDLHEASLPPSSLPSADFLSCLPLSLSHESTSPLPSSFA
jgi:amino acid transporter